MHLRHSWKIKQKEGVTKRKSELAKSGRRRAFGEENGRIIWHDRAIQRPVFVSFGTSLAEQRVESSSFKPVSSDYSLKRVIGVDSWRWGLPLAKILVSWEDPARWPETANS